MDLTGKDKAVLALADGTVVHGKAVGHTGTTGGELCFNTSMTGYQEIFTDPSYHGQLMMMTYPHIGNYGVSERDDEARKVMISGLIVRSFSKYYSNTMAYGDLDTYLKRNKIVGITGVDTRRLVRQIREKGVINAIISSEITDEAELVKRAQEWPSMVGLELATKVSRTEPQIFKPGEHQAYRATVTQESELAERRKAWMQQNGGAGSPGKKDSVKTGFFRVAAFDYGIKQNIINSLVERGCLVRVFPARTDFETVNQWNPDAYFFSNGPGDPTTMDYALQAVLKARETGKPIFGICLGHQLMAMSEDMKITKMLVGHRGANQPVKNLRRGRVEITTQNHGFAVDPHSVDDALVEVTHRNLNDGTLEGLEFKRFDGFSVQYHPEASPGPHDSSYLFDQFVDRIITYKEQNGSH